MSLPPYLLGPHPWATMMAQQQLAAVAHAQAQAHAQAMQAQQALITPQVPQPPKPGPLTEEQLQEKGIV